MADSPTDAFCRWFEALPDPIADDLAISLRQLFPGGALSSTIITARPSDGLTAKLRRLAAAPLLDAGVALTLSALTDFVFHEKGDPESWKQSEALLEVLDEAQEALGEVAESAELGSWIEENKMRYPFRARQWMKEIDGWRRLRSGPLDPANIQRGLRDAMLEQMGR
jgi:hypothetical protein